MRETEFMAKDYFALSAQRRRDGSHFAEYWFALGKMWQQIDDTLQEEHQDGAR